jgi:hypothetical protein
MVRIMGDGVCWEETELLNTIVREFSMLELIGIWLSGFFVAGGTAMALAVIFYLKKKD